jgi:hypothetical protein
VTRRNKKVFVPVENTNGDSDVHALEIAPADIRAKLIA